MGCGPIPSRPWWPRGSPERTQATSGNFTVFEGQPSLEQLGQAAGQLITLAGDLGELLLKFDDAADGR
jgi:hypothetical protein